MATAHQKLALSLAILKSIQDQGVRVIKASEHKALTRVHRERLQAAVFIKPAMPGWYLPSRPDEQSGDSTSWYANMEAFVAAYANFRFGSAWQLAPDQSLVIQSGETTVAHQIQIHSPNPATTSFSCPTGVRCSCTRSSQMPLASRSSSMAMACAFCHWRSVCSSSRQRSTSFDPRWHRLPCAALISMR